MKLLCLVLIPIVIFCSKENTELNETPNINFSSTDLEINDLVISEMRSFGINELSLLSDFSFEALDHSIYMVTTG
ncbi:MAG: hypothetical protein HRT68_13660 [Flavobacteriaceae bacterium]|nr:hypothetical protein [Flavobacteriaceae bacterium]